MKDTIHRNADYELAILATTLAADGHSAGDSQWNSQVERARLALSGFTCCALPGLQLLLLDCIGSVPEMSPAHKLETRWINEFSKPYDRETLLRESIQVWQLAHLAIATDCYE